MHHVAHSNKNLIRRLCHKARRRRSKSLMRRVFTFLVAHFIVLSAAPSLIADDNLAYLDRTQPVEKRVDDLLSRLTLDEKLLLIAADPTAGTSLDTPMIERLRIPRFSMTDGPHGANFAKHFRTGATAFPSGIGLASSWNTELIENVGRAIARETKAQGRNVILGPCINIHRTPFGGRNFESFSEDPYLASRMTVSYVHGVQSMGVVSCLKHFACNNQERDRMFIDVQVSERALHEIYLPAFRAGVQEGGAWFVMSAYNKLNGHWASENQRLLTDVLKKQWDFRGAVISDWGAVHSTVPTANAGLDLEMGGTTFFADPLRTAISHGEVPLDIIDDKVRRLLRVMMSTGLFDEPWAPRHSAEELYRRPRGTGDFDASMYDMPTRFDNDTLDGPENRALALQAAREGIVLLKNSDDILPLDKEWIGSLAVIGPNAAWGNTGGGGSSETKSAYTTTPLEGLLKLVGDEVKVRYELGSTFDQRYNIPLVKAEFLLPPNNAPDSPGLRGEYFGNSELTGEPMAVTTEPHIFFHWGTNAPQPEMPEHSWSARWTGRLAAPQSGTYRLYLFHHGAFYASEQG
ncbi:MAG TPA: glycoside hydrolase family 3 N-terminal domain-containing protein, partial [Lacipirellulaceae bacterium]|nr:glycoside hydrolase family 3 N-terminal domain-containing protein [Lacipirellulaceae bacterium]